MPRASILRHASDKDDATAPTQMPGDVRDHPRLHVATASDRSPLHDVRQHATRLGRSRSVRIRFSHERACWRPACRHRTAQRAPANLRTRKRIATASGGARRDRTDDLLLAKQALSQLSYGPSGIRASAGSKIEISSLSLSDDRPLMHESLALVGLGRLELPTSRLSSARSNQLSYKPAPGVRVSRSQTNQQSESNVRSDYRMLITRLPGLGSFAKKEKRRRRRPAMGIIGLETDLP